MASVIGVLFFLVLLMSLDIVDQQAPAASIRTVALEDISELQDEILILEKRLKQIEEETEKIVSDTNLASAGSKHLLNKVTDLRQTLVAVYRSIKEQQEQLRLLANESKLQRDEHNDKVIQLERRTRELANLKEQLRLVKSKPPITYIRDRTDPMEPWLLELTDRAIRVAASDGRTAVLEFTADTFTMRKERFLGWARSQNHLTHYFVIMKKPSGLQYENEIEKAIKDVGFSIGTDLVSEDYELF